MQTKWLDEKIKYDGTQLSPLYTYLNHGILGDSILAWQGACDVNFEHMIDGEDLRAKSIIAGNNMLHFVLELFQFPLSSAVTFQRLMGELLKAQVYNYAKVGLIRKGDDLYWNNKKFNISIATCSNTSSLIHFGFNVTNEGTPVDTCALMDFRIEDIKSFAREYMELVEAEYLSIRRATMKVRSF